MVCTTTLLIEGPRLRKRVSFCQPTMHISPYFGLRFTPILNRISLFGITGTAAFFECFTDIPRASSPYILVSTGRSSSQIYYAGCHGGLSGPIQADHLKIHSETNISSIDNRTKPNISTKYHHRHHHHQQQQQRSPIQPHKAPRSS